ncbi:hypothetical protein G6F63_013972 [Rhizopus arrhizus]|nr:hypothetical protein G6F63_013972 [Rhizopus arrhizus]
MIPVSSTTPTSLRSARSDQRMVPSRPGRRPVSSARVLCREAGRGRRDDLRDGRWRRSNADASAFQRPIAHHVFDHAGKIRQQPHHAGKEFLAGGGQQHAPAGACKELGGESLLQLAYQARDRGLRLEQALGGMGETGFLRHRNKGGQVLQGDMLGQAIHFKPR